MINCYLVPIFANYAQRYYIFFIYASARNTFLKKDTPANTRHFLRKTITSIDFIEKNRAV